jgi:hypothetical protein
VADVVPVAEEFAGPVEDGVGVGAGADLEVDANGVHAGGDGPHVQVVGLDDRVELREVMGDVVDVDVRRGGLDQDPERVPAELVGAGEDEQADADTDVNRSLGVVIRPRCTPWTQVGDLESEQAA